MEHLKGEWQNDLNPAHRQIIEFFSLHHYLIEYDFATYNT